MDFKIFPLIQNVVESGEKESLEICAPKKRIKVVEDESPARIYLIEENEVLFYIEFKPYGERIYLGVCFFTLQ